MTPYDQERDIVGRIGAYSMRADRLAALLEEDPVRAWRRSRFIAMGCDSLLADLLAGSNVVPEAYGRLILAGCAFDVAARILL